MNFNKIFWAAIFSGLMGGLILIALGWNTKQSEATDSNWMEIDPNDIIYWDSNSPNCGVYLTEGSATIGEIGSYSALTITCEDGNEVTIDIIGNEIKVTGACEEGAKIFFNELLKPIADEYVRTKKKEIVIQEINKLLEKSL